MHGVLDCRSLKIDCPAKFDERGKTITRMFSRSDCVSVVHNLQGTPTYLMKYYNGDAEYTVVNPSSDKIGGGLTS